MADCQAWQLANLLASAPGHIIPIYQGPLRTSERVATVHTQDRPCP